MVICSPESTAGDVNNKIGHRGAVKCQEREKEKVEQHTCPASYFRVEFNR